MSKIIFTDLPTVTTLDGNELVAVSHQGSTQRTTVNNLAISMGEPVKYQYISADGTSLSWTEANTAAQARGGQLAIVRNSTDLNKLNTYADSVNYGIGAWIGLRKVSGNWKWVDGSALSTSNWGSGEPNDAFGNEDYVHMLRNWPGLAANSWNDIDNAASNGSHFGSPRFGYMIQWY